MEYNKVDVTYKLDLNKLVDMSPYKKLLIQANKSETERAVEDLLKDLVLKVEKRINEDDCSECIRYFLNSSAKYELYTCGEIFISEDCFEIFKKFIVISKEESIKLCFATLEQSSNELWFLVRNLRFSASSNIHSIKTQTNKSTESLVNEILNPKKVDTPSMRYGILNEKNARAEYKALYNCNVRVLGVLVSPKQPWLYASLDGVVFLNGVATRIVEVFA